MALIYLIRNKENQKVYVGKTIRPLSVRWGDHVRGARRADNDMLICRSIKKYGPEAFEVKILEECSEEQCSDVEKKWISKLESHVSLGGYNLTLGGEGRLGFKLSEETKEKIRQKALGRKHTEETKELLSSLKTGKKQRPEHVEIRRASNTGKKRTEETKRRMSVAQQKYASTKRGS